MFQYLVNQGIGNDSRIQIVVFPSYGHATVVKEGGQHHCRDAVGKGPGIFFFKAGLDARFMKEAEDFQCIATHDLHVDGAVVVQSQAIDGYCVGVVLYGFYFIIFKQDFCKSFWEVVAIGEAADHIVNKACYLAFDNLFFW